MSVIPTNAPISLPPAVPVLMPAEEALPTYDDLVTEDHKPVERILVEKLYRLLTHPLYANWPGPEGRRPFLVMANVGLFYKAKTPAVVPDCLLSLNVNYPEDLHVKQGHSYYVWQMGKAPDVVIEIVSDKLGGEDTFKRELYAEIGVPYYAIFDPDHYLSEETLRTYQLNGKKYRPVDPGPWEDVGLGLRLWKGEFEGVEETWLRWCDANGEIIPTGEERAAELAQDLQQRDDRIRQLEREVRRLKKKKPSK
jgi:Uma2 family endonuclease